MAGDHDILDDTDDMFVRDRRTSLRDTAISVSEVCSWSNVRIETTQGRLEDFENQGVERKGREGWWESAPR